MRSNVVRQNSTARSSGSSYGNTGFPDGDNAGAGAKSPTRSIGGGGKSQTLVGLRPTGANFTTRDVVEDDRLFGPFASYIDEHPEDAGRIARYVARLRSTVSGRAVLKEIGEEVRLKIQYRLNKNEVERGVSTADPKERQRYAQALHYAIGTLESGFARGALGRRTIRRAAGELMERLDEQAMERGIISEWDYKALADRLKEVHNK
ncbi:hypothetical protein [Paraburkholderia humisilvae]|uniref:Uncharacterized protein n=1 Tax=Paraburkholderia humisilvae TaxID=627669 RepID=A0A6J5FAB4_9BURK|nr:hypothetical protein [Paraburkholderia humisilvae]CAB3774612.1 hypothetical protein LMG29542_07990 [Paraburkholderia humisilvae]